MHRPERPRASALAWIVSATLPLAGAVAAMVLVERTAADVRWIVLAAAVLSVAGLFQVPSSERDRFTPGYVVVASLPFISESGRRVFDLTGAAAVLAIGLTVLWVIRTARGDDQRLLVVSLVGRALAYTAYLLGHAAGASWLPAGARGTALFEWRDSLLFLSAAAAAFLVELLFSTVFRRRTGGRARLYLAYLMVRNLDVFISLVASGALFGLAFDAIGWVALAVAALPYAFAHGSFRRFQAAKSTYGQTIRALAQIPEVGGHTDPGHAARTAELSVAVARGMGLRPSEVELVEYASLLHDIGRVTLNEPSVLRQGFTENDIARWGSEIVDETGYLRQVASIVRRQYEPYRNPGEQDDPDVPLAARIVKVCSAYDEATSELGFSALESMERLHRGSVYDYDPEVVAILRRVLEDRRTFDAPKAVA